jgi:putative membrane protein
MGENNIGGDNVADDSVQRDRKISWGGLIIRFIVSAIVLMVTAFFTPGFAIAGFGTALMQAVVIVGLDYLIQEVTGIDASPFGRGFTGFIISALIIYITQFIIPGIVVTLLGAVIAALIIGIIEAIVPVKMM